MVNFFRLRAEYWGSRPSSRPPTKQMEPKLRKIIHRSSFTTWIKLRKRGIKNARINWRGNCSSRNLRDWLGALASPLCLREVLPTPRVAAANLHSVSLDSNLTQSWHSPNQICLLICRTHPLNLGRPELKKRSLGSLGGGLGSSSGVGPSTFKSLAPSGKVGRPTSLETLAR